MDTAKEAHLENDFRKDSQLEVLADIHEDNPFFYDLSPSYRWFMVVSFVIMTVFTGPTYMNWPPMRDMLSWAGAYSHLCDGDPTREVGDYGEIKCEEKALMLSSMYGPAVAVMFSMDLIAGIFLDCFGGKIVTIFGLSLQVLGWILIALSGPAFNAYYIGLLLTSIGNDPTFFGEQNSNGRVIRSNYMAVVNVLV